MTEQARRGIVAPLISVMIPVFEPDALLIEALEAVLKQRNDLGAERMQITAIDDCSRRVDVPALLRRFIEASAIEYHSNRENLGLAANWNHCLHLSRGTFVHLLHQDDVIRPGFYRRLVASFERRPDVGMAFCRHGFIDGSGTLADVSHRERLTAGVLRNWLPKIARETRIQTPAAVVRRAVYERLGGFRLDLKYALDWEMWTRIALHYDVWYEPTVLAHYRRHFASETARLTATGAADLDVLRTIEIIGGQLPPERRNRLIESAYLAFARRRIKRARKLIAQRQYLPAQAALRYAQQALLRVAPGVNTALYEWRIKRLLREAASRAHARSA